MKRSSGMYFAVLRKNTAWPFKIFEISLDETWIFYNFHAYIPLQFSGNLDLIAEKSVWKFREIIFSIFSANSVFIGEDLATSVLS